MKYSPWDGWYQSTEYPTCSDQANQVGRMLLARSVHGMHHDHMQQAASLHMFVVRFISKKKAHPQKQPAAAQQQTARYFAAWLPLELHHINHITTTVVLKKLLTAAAAARASSQQNQNQTERQTDTGKQWMMMLECISVFISHRWRPLLYTS